MRVHASLDDGENAEVLPTHPAVIRTVHASLVCGPQLFGVRAGAEQRRGAIVLADAGQPPRTRSQFSRVMRRYNRPIRAARDVRGVWS